MGRQTELIEGVCQMSDGAINVVPFIARSLRVNQGASFSRSHISLRRMNKVMELLLAKA